MRADLDHTLDWLLGGLTEADNLGALCEPHHLLKHDPDSGWSVVQPSAGHFMWTSPTGTRHRVEPERYDGARRPPAPRRRAPRASPTSCSPHRHARPPPGRRDRNKHGHLTDAARATATRLTRAATPATPDAPPTRYDDDPDF